MQEDFFIVDYDYPNSEPDSDIDIGRENEFLSSGDEIYFSDSEDDPIKKKKNIVVDPIDDIFIDASFCNFVDKKRGDAILITKSLYKNLEKKYAKRECSWDFFRIGPSPGRDITNISRNLPKIIKELLEIGAGNIVLAGGAIRDAMRNINRAYEDFDIFFYGVSEEEADVLLTELITKITEKRIIEFERSQCVVTVTIMKTKYTPEIKIQFIKRLYKTKGQILLGFDLAGSRIGYDNEGFFATIDGALASITNSFLLDLTQRSTSFGWRLNKYVRIKDYTLYFPNLTCRSDKLDEYEIMTKDGILEKSRISTRTLKGRPVSNNWYFNLSRYQKSDYDENKKGYCNMTEICLGKYHNVKFSSETYQDIIDLPESIIRAAINKGKIWNINFNGRIPPPLNLDVAKAILGESYDAFIQELYINNNRERAKEIWYSRKDIFIQKGKEIAEYINRPENSWKIDNPMSQSFGKFNPILENPREWFLDHRNYEPFVVGISDDRIFAFRLCRLKCEFMKDIPDDIFDLIIREWLYAEGRDAWNRVIK